MNKVEIRVLEFYLWKFKFQDFRLVKTCSIDQNDEEKFLLVLIGFWFLFDQSKRSFNWYSISFDWSRHVKTEFLQNFLVTVLNVWKGFKPCEQFYETFLTLHWCLLKGYNPIGINSDSCSLVKRGSLSLKIVSKKHKKSCEYFPKLLFIEPNKLGCIPRANLYKPFSNLRMGTNII